MTGPSGAGCHTVARAVVDELIRRGRPAVLIDRAGVESYLSRSDPEGAVRWLAGLLTTGDVMAVIATPAPTRAIRDRARAEISPFAEIFVDPSAPATSPAPGHDDHTYEEPYGAELRVPTHDRDAPAAAALVVSWLEAHGGIAAESP